MLEIHLRTSLFTVCPNYLLQHLSLQESRSHPIPEAENGDWKRSWDLSSKSPLDLLSSIGIETPVGPKSGRCLLGMSCGDLLSIQPSELKFPFELKKQSSCPMVLTNKTDQYVAFKVKTTNPKKYCVRPNAGVVSPGSTCDVTVTMQAQKESPPDMQCKDKFLVQSVVATHGATAKDITSELFNKEAGKVVDEFKLRVIYIPANPPSPVPEGSEEGSSPRASLSENGNPNASLFDAVSRSLEEPMEKPSEAFMISKLTEEKTSAIQQNQKLRQELELLRRDISKSQGAGFSFIFVVLIGLMGILVGYWVKKT